MIVKAIKTKIFKPKDNLLVFIEEYLPIIEENSILVITSKIVALAEDRVVENFTEDTKLDIVRQESELVLQTKHVLLTIKDGVVMANAGIDESNADGKLILLPKDSFQTAQKVRDYFRKKHQLKNIGVIITDSRCLPLRAGITGVALGYAGFRGLKSYANELDIFKRPFKFAKVDIADSLATAAVLCMGEGSEQKPLAVVSDISIEYTDDVIKDELKIDIEDDMYRPMFERIRPM
jgi:dihydrofolate synthase / folylpolyglutamate synthase